MSMIDPTGHAYMSPNDVTTLIDPPKKQTYNYIFYSTGKNADFSGQALYQGKQFVDGGKKVIMRKIDSRLEFKDAWDGMGSVGGIRVNIGTVKILTHSNGKAIMFQDGTSTEAYSVTGRNSNNQEIGDINKLLKKNIQCLDLLSCNSGHLDMANSKEGNVAQAFARHGTIGVVYGYDGSVGVGHEGIGSVWSWITGDYFSRQSNEQGSFHNMVAKNGGVVGREPVGRVEYYSGGRFSAVGGY